MLFSALTISGAMLVRLDRKIDERGFFARSFCANEFSAHGLPSALVQTNVSYNARRGTIRGMHFQWPPSREGKLVRCVRGKLWDLILDLRPDSPSYLRHQGVLLDDDNRDAIFIPSGVAHGFQTLADHTEILYQMTDYYAPELQVAYRWNDPAFAIAWPSQDAVISDRDANAADFLATAHAAEYRARSGGMGRA